MVRTRFAPSPTGFMHIGNLRTALYEYLFARKNKGVFILRVEDTDQKRLVDGSLEIIYKTLDLVGITCDEDPRVGGAYGPYIQSERKSDYMKYALELIEKGGAYRCFCTKSSEETSDDTPTKYDRTCHGLSEEEIEKKLQANTEFVVRQFIPEGKTTFTDEVYGEITVENEELEDMVLIKSDGLPTYNFANVVDDRLMAITHVVRGSEYLSSTPKYNILYDTFGWQKPIYIHLPLILSPDGGKLSKRKGDAAFEDLLEQGYLVEAIVNFIALLGWSPSDNTEIFSLEELIEAFDVKGLSKSPSVFDKTKLTWFNTEYIKKMEAEKFYELAENYLKANIKREGIDLKKVAKYSQSRVSFVKDIVDLVDFIDQLPTYSTDLYLHKKMKTTIENSLASLQNALEVLKTVEDFTEENLDKTITALIEKMEIKNGLMLWPLRTALSGKPTSFCGAVELLALLGKDESIARIEKGIELLKASL